MRKRFVMLLILGSLIAVSGPAVRAEDPPPEARRCYIMPSQHTCRCSWLLQNCTGVTCNSPDDYTPCE
jgi:hypothetical protein